MREHENGPGLPAHLHLEGGACDRADDDRKRSAFQRPLGRAKDLRAEEAEQLRDHRLARLGGNLLAQLGRDCGQLPVEGLRDRAVVEHELADLRPALVLELLARHLHFPCLAFVGIECHAGTVAGSQEGVKKENVKIYLSSSDVTTMATFSKGRISRMSRRSLCTASTASSYGSSSMTPDENRSSIESSLSSHSLSNSGLKNDFGIALLAV